MLHYVQTGWLHHDTLVEFKLYERAVHIWKRKHLGKDLFVKVTPVDVAMASQASFSMDLDESVDISETRARNKSWPLVNAAVSTDRQFQAHFLQNNKLFDRPFLIDHQFITQQNNVQSFRVSTNRASTAATLTSSGRSPSSELRTRTTASSHSRPRSWTCNPW